MTRLERLLAAAAVGILAVLAAAPASSATAAYYRQPDIHADRIVFCAEGDLWTAPAGPASPTTTRPTSD